MTSSPNQSDPNAGGNGLYPAGKCCERCDETLRGNFYNKVPITFCNNHSCPCHRTEITYPHKQNELDSGEQGFEIAPIDGKP